MYRHPTKSAIVTPQVPADPVAKGASHHQLLIAAFEPWQLLGEHRHALPVRAGHPRDVRSPEHPPRPERVVHLAEIFVDIAIGIRLTGIARRSRRLDCDVRILCEGEKVRQIRESRIVERASDSAKVIDENAAADGAPQLSRRPAGKARPEVRSE